MVTPHRAVREMDIAMDTRLPQCETANLVWLTKIPSALYYSSVSHVTIRIVVHAMATVQGKVFESASSSERISLEDDCSRTRCLQKASVTSLLFRLP